MWHLVGGFCNTLNCLELAVASFGIWPRSLSSRRRHKVELETVVRLWNASPAVSAAFTVDDLILL